METTITRTFDLLDHLVVNYPKEDILSGKVNGEWFHYSSHDFYKYAHFIAYGLIELDIKPGDRVITISNNCPEWNFIDMALSLIGAIHVPIYPTLSTENYVHILRHSEPKMVLVSSNLLLRRIKPAFEQLYETGEGPTKPMVYTLANIEGQHRTLEILKLGIANREKHRATLDARKEQAKPDDWVTLIYTSGTTGDPKGVMLSHRNLCSNFLAHSQVNVMGSNDRVLSFLPLNHMYERSMNYHYLYLGCSIYYAESLGTLQQNMQEIGCSGFCAVPRVLEMFYDKLYAAGKDFSGIRKFIYFRAFKHGMRFDRGIIKKMSISYQISQYFYDKMVYSRWREKFGGHRMTVISGSSSIPERLIRLFSAAGICVYEGYGLSETSPVIAVNNPREGLVRFGTVGPILKGVEVKFAEDGEILTRGPHVMLGYYKDPDYTKQVIDEEGWFHTGDIGKIVANRYLKITDRKKDIFKLSAGKYIAPQVLENKLRESEYIDQAMVVGEHEKYAAAIISPNFNTLHYWALKHHLHYRDNVALIALPEVMKKMQEEIDLYNKEFAPHEQIKKFRLVSEEWTSANGLLSPTLKIRRNILQDKYKDTIRDIFGKGDEPKNGIFSAFRSVELPSIKLPFRGN